MKQRIGFLFLFAMLFCTLKGLAEENEYILKYSFNEEDGTATVTGYEGNPVDVVVPETVSDEDGKEYMVTSIGDHAFRGCSSLTTIDLPSTLTTIEMSAFGHCSALTSLDMPDSIINISQQAFSFYSSLSYVKLPNSIKSLDQNLFEGCTSLEYIDLPDSIVSIVNGVFLGCSALKSIVLPPCITYIGRAAFLECKALESVKFQPSHSSVNSIGIIEECFQYCTALRSVEWPSVDTNIGDRCFQGCSSLQSIQSNYLGFIGGLAFEGCSSLEKLVIPESIVKIGNGAFSNCISLKEITFPKNLRRDYNSDTTRMFEGCDEIEKITYLSDDPFTINTDNFDTSVYETALLEIPISSTEKYEALSPWNLFKHISKMGDGNENEEEEKEKFRLTYLFNTDGTATVTGYEGEEPCYYLVIPDEIQNEDGETYSVIAIGDNAFSSGYFASVELPASLTTIGNGAFTGCELITIDFPESVQSIGERAFSHCRYLTSALLPESLSFLGNHAFYLCERLGSINIPGSLTTIQESTFNGCKSLVKVSIPETVTSLGNYAFAYCDALIAVSLPESINSLGEYVFDRCRNLSSLNIPQSLTFIGEGCFNGCESLTEIKLPESLQSISRMLLQGCRGLTSIDFPKTVTSIGNWSLGYCSSVTSIVLPDVVTSIMHYAFSDCKNLRNVVLSPSLSDIWDYAFRNSPLERINYLTKSPVSAEDNIFDSSVYDTATLEIPKGAREAFMATTPWNLFKNIVEVGEEEQTYGLYYSFNEDNGTAIVTGYEGEPVNVVIPEDVEENGKRYTVTSIGDTAFLGCNSLREISLPGGLSTIGDDAFCSCDFLTTINMPVGLTSIGDDAFWGCTSLSSLSLPESLVSIGFGALSGTGLISISLPVGVNNIGEEAFKECPLDKIAYPTQSPISADEKVFDSSVYDTATLEIPKGAREAFMATTPWNLFKNIVEVGEDDPDPTPGEGPHLLTVNIKNGFTAKLKVNHGEKALVSLDLDEWWEPGEVHFNSEPMTVEGNEFETPEMTEPATLTIAPRFKGEVDILEYIPTVMEKVEANGITVEIYAASTVLIKGLQDGDEITVYTEGAHIIRSATATGYHMGIENLVPGNIYIIRINSYAVKVML